MATARQGNRIDRMKHEEVTREILAACFEVANELGHAFVESVYERALLVVLRDRGG